LGTYLANSLPEGAQIWLSSAGHPAVIFSMSGRVLDVNPEFVQLYFTIFHDIPKCGVFWNALVAKNTISSTLREFARSNDGTVISDRDVVISDYSGELKLYRIGLRKLKVSGSLRPVIGFNAVDVTKDLVVECDRSLLSGILSPSMFFLLDGPDIPKIPTSWEARIHSEDVNNVLKALQQQIPVPWTYRLISKTGGWRWFLTRPVAVDWTTQGVPTKFKVFHEDVTRAKRLEQTMTEAELRWNSVVNTAPVSIALLGQGGRILFCNGRLETFLPSDSVGHSLNEFFTTGLSDKFIRSLELCFSTGQPVVMTSSKNIRDQSVVTFEHILGPNKGNGGVESVVLFSFDTTERSRWERHASREALVQEFILDLHSQDIVGDELFNKTLQAAMELTSSEFGFIAVGTSPESLEVKKMFSFPDREEFQSSEWDMGLWVGAIELNSPLLENGVQDLPVGLGEIGETIHRSLAIPLSRSDGTVALIVVGQRVEPFGEDDIFELRSLLEGVWQVKERKQIEQSNRLLLQALEFIPASVVITDPQGRIEYVNQFFSDLMGFGKEEVLGSSIEIIDSQMTPSVTSEEIRDSIRQGRSWQGELVNKKKGGQLLWQSVSVAPVRDPSGNLSHFVSVQEDITEKRQSQEALLQARKMESVGQLAAGVAHDFNNLLTSLLAMNEMLLLKLPEGDPLRVFPEKIGKAGRRAADLVCSLLAFGRRQRLRQEVIDLRDLLREEAGLLESMLRGDVVLRTLLEGPPVLVDVDAGQISQVVMNLVSNARDEMSSGGTITIGAGVGPVPSGGAEEWAYFSVEDDGPGVPTEIREHIFEPFFTTKEIGKGTGLGLSVVSGIVEQHHGKIILESDPGQGALFTIYLPLAGLEPPILDPVE